MYEPLLQIADTLDKNPACVTEWNGKGLFFSAEGNFEGPFDTVEQYMQWKSVGEIVGEYFPFFAEAPVSRRFVQRTWEPCGCTSEVIYTKVIGNRLCDAPTRIIRNKFERNLDEVNVVVQIVWFCLECFYFGQFVEVYDFSW